MKRLISTGTVNFMKDAWKPLVFRATRFASSSPKDFASQSTGEFLPLEIPGHTSKRQAVTARKKREMPEPRSSRLRPDTDWTNVWPAASSFKWSVVPLPIRQGYIDKACENQGVSPAAYANNELLKVPNFLHLTPAHVAKHTSALRRFCTPWPAKLNDDVAAAQFPIAVETCAYVRSGSSVRDPRARSVRTKFPLSALSLDSRARDKFIRLLGGYDSRCYNSKTDMVTLETDRCPSRKQNYDFLMYAIQVLYMESRKTESWETTERAPEDYATFQFELSQSYRNVVELLKRTSRRGDAEVKVDELMRSSNVTAYRDALCNLHDKGESAENLAEYKRSVLQLLALDQPNEAATSTAATSSSTQ